MLTDSGLGGLSVLAHLTLKLNEGSNAGKRSGLKLVYINAVPRDGYGYNDMPSRKERISVFGCILEEVHSRYQPDRIFVACGSLSALLEKLPFGQDHPGKLQGIDVLSRQMLEDAMEKYPGSQVFVFAAPTTISEKIYGRDAIKTANSELKIYGQPCPGLASLISSDSEGAKVEDAVRGFCQEALARWDGSRADSGEGAPIVFLGCTHYSFRAESFVKAFASLGYPEIQLIDPNPAAAEMLAGIFREDGTRGQCELEFLTPYPLPASERIGMGRMLEDLSPQTAAAFRQARVIPELAS